MPATQPTPWRIWAVSGFHGLVYPTTMWAVNQSKYINSVTTPFYWRNDNSHWLQVDKFGQFAASYRISQVSTNLFFWAGIEQKKAAAIGSIIGFSAISSFELFDGQNSLWGASFGDIAINALGAGLLYSQFYWKEPLALNIKMSTQPSIYANYFPEVLGRNRLERIFNDYNAQTYWFTARLKSLVPYDKIPEWLNIAVGYGANGMLHETKNPLFDTSGNPIPNFDRYRQFYFSFDVDIRRIKTKYPFVNAVFKNFGFIKIPSPTLEFSRQGITFYPIFL